MAISTKQDLVHPWRRGFRPHTAVCPQCGGRHALWFTGERTEHSFHVYHCDSCGVDVAAPTFYAWCEADNEMLEKDQFWTPCIHGGCLKFESVGEHSPHRCKHFKPAQSGDLDEKHRRQIEDSMKKFLEPDPRAQAVDQGNPGVPTQLEKMRQERLEKMRNKDA